MKHSILLLLTIIGFIGYAQVPIGTWTSHTANNKGIGVCEVGNKIYCMTETGLFYFNKIDNSINRIGKNENLYGINNTAIYYDKANESIYIGYDDGTIDILDSRNRVSNMQDITRKSYTQKKINKIKEDNGKIYFCTGFGIVVFNPERLEFMETYIIGDNGYEYNVSDITFDDNFIYAATDYGVKKASKSNNNLANYEVWERITEIPFNTLKFKSVAIYNNKLITTHASKYPYNYKTYVLDTETDYAYQLNPDAEHYVQNLKVVDNQLMVIHKRHITFYDESLNTPTEFIHETPSAWGDFKMFINDALVDKDGILWLAGDFLSLIGHKNEGEYSTFARPSGPINNSAFYIKSKNKTTWLAAGGLHTNGSNTYTDAGISRYKDGKWRTYDKSKIPEFETVQDIIAIEFDPYNDNKIYCCSGNSGVLELDFSNEKNIAVKLYNDTTSTLTPLYDHLVKVLESNFDRNGNLWTVSPRVPNPISVMKPNGDWFTFNKGNPNYDYGKFIISEDGTKWIIVQRGHGLFVFNENGTIENDNDDFAKHISIKDNEGTIISNEIHSIAEDKDGHIWVGTLDGVAVFYSPRNIYNGNSSNFYASRIVIGLNGRDQYLMNDKKVTAITIDGANRKWIGTYASGIYLVSEDGTKQIQHFNTDNSPLPSNMIKSISIDNASGEVFIATGGGLMSYRSDATQGLETFKDVYTFPNPVKADYSGPITIKGLIENSTVKITDVAGNLVTEIKPLGGQAIWDGKNLNGNRVKTGVYLVLLTSQNGEQTAVSKIMFIN